MYRHDLHRVLIAFTLAVVAAGAAACGGQQTAMTAPTSAAARASSTTSSMPGASGAVTGATITGTVVGLSSASTMKTLGTSMTVSVTGSTASTTVDGSGHFTLVNVPTGHVELHFVGNGTDALLGLDGVAEHSTLAITVRVSGHDAHLEPGGDSSGQQGEVELNGLIAAGSLSGSCAGHNLSFMVGTTKVTTNASTQFNAASCDSLKAGGHVELEGTRQTDGSVLAMSVQGDGEDNNSGNDNQDGNGDNQNGQNAEVKGTIAAGSIAGACASNSLSFKVGSTTVKTNAATQFKDTPCASLKAGDSVEVKGARQPDASVLASSVERNN